MIAAVNKVAMKCNGSCQSLSCQKMEVQVHALSEVLGFLSGGGSSFSWTVCPGLEKRARWPKCVSLLSPKCPRTAARCCMCIPCLSLLGSGSGCKQELLPCCSPSSLLEEELGEMPGKGALCCSPFLLPLDAGVMAVCHIRLKVQITNA